MASTEKEPPAQPAGPAPDAPGKPDPGTGTPTPAKAEEGKPAPAPGAETAPQPLEETPEPLEDAPEPLDDPSSIRPGVKSSADSTDFRRAVMEPGHGGTDANLPVISDAELVETSLKLKPLSDSSGKLKASPDSSDKLKASSDSSDKLKTQTDSSGKLKTLSEGKGRGKRSSAGLKAVPEGKAAPSGVLKAAPDGKSTGSSATLKILTEPLPVPPGIDTPSAVHRALEELPTVEELDVAKLSDEDLMRLCQDGDEAAFEVLFQRYEGPALSFIYRMIGDRNRTEALGQEAFLRIFKDAKSYQYPRSFSTWFYTIVRNLCKNELRWRSRHPTVSIEESVGGSRGRNDSDSVHIGDNLRSETTDPLELMVSTELTGKLDEALKELPELERDILILKCFQGLKYREIADVVGVPVGTVRSRIHAALERLRKSVKDYL
ncbi:MAG: sigma-70 family RNA polymerase sigma factor [Planctomycetes bacterium]|nr:sigma-70 family RNA polymerase sigma factor [Planctomycetota bacterium]